MELLRKTFRRLRAYARERRALRKLHGELDTCNAHLQLQVPFRQFVEARRRTGCDVDEYFAFEFFKKTPEQQETFLTRARRSEEIRAIGDLDMPSTIPGNKLLFNMIFGEFLARDWINPTQASSAEFVRFVREHGEVMIKPALDYGGKGIEVYRYADDGAALALHSQLRGQGMVVEERMVQHPDMARLNPHCINSVRVSTYTDCDDVHILFATARSGAGDGPVDNFTSGGMSAAVDWHTGVICADGIDQDYRRIQCHPLTGTALKGFQIPNWDKALDVVHRAARKAYTLPQCRWIGWDLAFLANGEVALLEGNWKQGSLSQNTHDTGVRLQLKELSKKR